LFSFFLSGYAVLGVSCYLFKTCFALSDDPDFSLYSLNFIIMVGKKSVDGKDAPNARLNSDGVIFPITWPSDDI